MGSPFRARRSAGALSAPVTRKTTVREVWRKSGQRVNRQPGRHHHGGRLGRKAATDGISRPSASRTEASGKARPCARRRPFPARGCQGRSAASPWRRGPARRSVGRSRQGLPTGVPRIDALLRRAERAEQGFARHALVRLRIADRHPALVPEEPRHAAHVETWRRIPPTRSSWVCRGVEPPARIMLAFPLVSNAADRQVRISELASCARCSASSVTMVRTPAGVASGIGEHRLEHRVPESASTSESRISPSVGNL